MKTHLITLIGINMLFLASACSTSESKEQAKIPTDKIPVKVWNIEKYEGAIALHGSGQFTTGDETILSFKTGGIIRKVLVSEGELIKKGQLLAILDLTEINTSVAQAQLGYEKAKRDFERTERLYADSVATLEQIQNAKTAFSIATQSLKAVQFNKEYSEIRAPKKGYILQKFVNTGQQISSGAPAFEMSGANEDNWKLKVALSDKEWAQLSEGDSAKIYSAVNPEKGFQAQVLRKTRQADPYTGAYTVELSFKENVPQHLANGMFGTADIYCAQSSGSWNIPYEALLDANGGYGFVFITESGEVARKIPVKVGKIFPDKVQITEGLADYSQLIISGSAYLTDHSPILIQK